MGRRLPGPPSYAAFACSPGSNELLVQAAKAAIAAEGLGKDDVPDLLSVSFSATDLIYHRFGPYSWEMQDALLRLDRQIADLVAAAEKAAGGRQNLLVVLSSDHGGAALPEELIAVGLNAVRVKPSVLKKGLAQELQTRFGAPLLLGFAEREVLINEAALAEKKLDGPTVRRAAAEWLSRQPGIALAVSRDDLDTGREMSGYLHALRRSHYPGRSGDVAFILKPFAVLMEEDTGTTHGEPYAYDEQVPLVLSGKNVKPGLLPDRRSTPSTSPPPRRCSWRWARRPPPRASRASSRSSRGAEAAGAVPRRDGSIRHSASPEPCSARRIVVLLVAGGRRRLGGLARRRLVTAARARPRPQSACSRSQGAARPSRPRATTRMRQPCWTPDRAPRGPAP